MKSLSRNFALTLLIAFAIGSIYGCAEKPITFAGPGVQIWKLNIVYDSGVEIKGQTLVLKPSETEKDVFHVTATIDTEGESERWGGFRVFEEWKGEIRNSAMMCNIDGIWTRLGSGGAPSSASVHGTAKGTFSKRRASGTSIIRGNTIQIGKWTAERIS